MDSKKVIIDLDEYLYMKENAKKLTDLLDILTKHTVIHEEKLKDPLSFGVDKSTYTMIIGEGYLREFLTNLMNVDPKLTDIKIGSELEGNLIHLVRK